jgi:hypothetical protein
MPAVRQYHVVHRADGLVVRIVPREDAVCDLRARRRGQAQARALGDLRRQASRSVARLPLDVADFEQPDLSEVDVGERRG